MAIKQGKMLFITSVKGGTGKTITTLNLAGIYARMKKRVLLVDLDFYGSQIAFALNLEVTKDIFNVVTDVNNNKFTKIEDYITTYQECIDVLPAPRDPRSANKIHSKYVNIVLSKAKAKYDIILIDSSHILSDLNLLIMDHSDQIIYIMNNDPFDVKNMKSMVSIYKDMEKKNFKIILNNSVNKYRDYYTMYDLKNIIGSSIDYTIPTNFFMKNIEKYVIEGKIPTLDKKIRSSYKKGITHLERIATNLIKE